MSKEVTLFVVGCDETSHPHVASYVGEVVQGHLSEMGNAYFLPPIGGPGLVSADLGRSRLLEVINLKPGEFVVDDKAEGCTCPDCGGTCDTVIEDDKRQYSSDVSVHLKIPVRVCTKCQLRWTDCVSERIETAAIGHAKGPMAMISDLELRRIVGLIRQSVAALKTNPGNMAAFFNLTQVASLLEKYSPSFIKAALEESK